MSLLAVCAVVLVTPAAAEDVVGPEGDFGEGLGTAAGWMLGVAGTIAVFNLVRRRWLLGWLRQAGRRDWIKPLMHAHRKWLMPVHGLAGTLSLVVGAWHAVLMQQHWLLWVAMAGMGFLTVGGALLQWKWTPAKVRKGVYLLHAQQLVFLGVIGLLLVGHAVV